MGQLLDVVLKTHRSLGGMARLLQGIKQRRKVSILNDDFDSWFSAVSISVKIGRNVALHTTLGLKL